jgi:tripartite-type tricarboxylate transporter receptor subunit TctC
VVLSRRAIVSAVPFGLIGAAAVPAWAEAYPSAPIRIIAPYPPGTATDLFARQLSPELSELLKTQVIVENRGGAGGMTGAAYVSHASPDGYTLLMATGQTQAIDISLYRRVPYDPLTGFSPIARLASQPLVLVVSPALGVHSVTELVQRAKAQPGKLNFASSGNGTSAHLAGVSLAHDAGIQIVHAPYTSVSQAISDLIGGEVQLLFYPYLALAPQVRAGKLLPIGVTGAQRSNFLPDVPTMVESGYPDFVLATWLALYGPPGMASDKVQMLTDAARATLQNPDILAKLKETGTDAAYSTPAELLAYNREQIASYKRLIDLAGVHLDD